MQSNQLPVLLQSTWAKGAGGGYIRQPPWLSQIGIQNGAASFADGFPPLCFLQKEAGGSFPFGQDFNGIFQLLSAGLQWLQAGGLALYNAVLSAAIGGYPLGAVLVKANGTGFWISVAEGNTSNPDGTTPTGWADLLAQYVKNDGRTYGINISGNATTATTAQSAVTAQTAINAQLATLAGAIANYAPAMGGWFNAGATSTSGVVNFTLQALAPVGLVSYTAGVAKVAVGGNYFVSGGFKTFSTVQNAGVARIEIFKNGASTGYANEGQIGTGQEYLPLATSGMVALAANDTVSIYVTLSAGMTLPGGPGHFSLHRVFSNE